LKAPENEDIPIDLTGGTGIRVLMEAASVLNPGANALRLFD
jgi:hypothetical protein